MCPTPCRSTMPAREDEVFYVLSGRGRWVGIPLPMR
jgi:hypothetical protein